MVWSITQYGKLSENQKLQAVEIFIDSFGHFMTFTKDKRILGILVYHALNPVYTYVFVENDTVIGILGLGTNKVRPIKFDKAFCIDFLGRFRGRLLCKTLNAIFQKKVVKNNRDLYIDVLATAKQYRGKGVATRLLRFSFNLQKYNNYYIEVMSKNLNAKSLYERMGFVEYKKVRVSPLSFRGYGYPIKMQKKGNSSRSGLSNEHQPIDKELEIKVAD